MQLIEIIIDIRILNLRFLLYKRSSKIMVLVINICHRDQRNTDMSDMNLLNTKQINRCYE